MFLHLPPCDVITPASPVKSRPKIGGLLEQAADLGSAPSQGETVYKYEHERLFFYFFYGISHITQLTPQELSAELKKSASAEALTVARRQKEASREKTRAAAGIRKFFSLHNVSHIIQVESGAEFCLSFYVWDAVRKQAADLGSAPSQGERV